MRTVPQARASTIVVGSILVLLLIVFVSIGAATYGGRGAIGFAFRVLGVFAILTGIYVLVTGRGSWAHLRGRLVGAIAVVAAVALFVSSGFVVPSQPPSTLAKATAESAQPQTDKAKGTQKATTGNKTKTKTRKSKASHGPKLQQSSKDKGHKNRAARQAKSTTTKAGVRAIAVLATLPIKGRAPKTGYERSEFGTAWVDDDHNGCDTRLICTL